MKTATRRIMYFFLYLVPKFREVFAVQKDSSVLLLLDGKGSHTKTLRMINNVRGKAYHSYAFPVTTLFTQDETSGCLLHEAVYT